MSKKTKKPMTKEAVKRIETANQEKNPGKARSDGFVDRAKRATKKNEG